jgi:hypothetical protein
MGRASLTGRYKVLIGAAYVLLALLPSAEVVAAVTALTIIMVAFATAPAVATFPAAFTRRQGLTPFYGPHL